MTILDTIAAYARERVRIKKTQVPPEVLREKALLLPKGSFPFEAALKKPDISFICECKKASPSKGLIAPDFPYLEIAKSYEAAGADAVSVLTEPKWFLGDDSYLREIAADISIPCLRKDFVVDEYMIYEAKLLGASAVLLIVSLLSAEELKHFIGIADTLGLSALVEVHDEAEIHTALSAGARIIGVNNRNLKDFSVDTENSRKLRALVPPSVLFVSESGVRTAEDVAALRAAGADAVLIGETLMRAEDRTEKLKELRGTPESTADLPGKLKTRFKFCGLRQPEDILAANALMPDYVGFVFYGKSTRYVTREEAAALKCLLDPRIRTVGVYVDALPETVADDLNSDLLDLAQLHGSEDASYIRDLRKLTNKPLIQAFRIRSREDLILAAESTADMVLLDSGQGSGTVLPWEILKGFPKPYFLAGGLTPENVDEAIRTLHPYALDVSSGIETDGCKDPVKMAAFAARVRNA